MNKFILFSFSFLLISACHYQSKSDFLEGTWNFESLQLDTNKIDISSYDNLTFKSDSTFHYQIESIQLNQKGVWYIDNKYLILKYQSPDSIRKFEIKVLSKFNLILEENTNRFVFSK